MFRLALTEAEISMAFFSEMPLTSASRSGSSSMIRMVSAPKRFRIREAKAAPMPLMAPEPRYLSTASSVCGATT